jgi:hypothetical protein
MYLKFVSGPSPKQALAFLDYIQFCRIVPFDPYSCSWLQQIHLC